MSVDARDLEDLIRLSRAAGRDRLLVQGGGGNSSVKSLAADRMWIKGSGIRLSQVGETAGWVEVALEPLLEMIGDETLARLPRRAAHDAAVRRVQAAAVGDGRPSLETGFHALFSRLVLHTHPVEINAFSCLVGGDRLLEEALDRPVPWVAYETPGFALSRAVAAALRDQSDEAHVVVLENHGLIVAGDDVDTVLAHTAAMVDAGRLVFGPLSPDLAQPSPVVPEVEAWADGLAAAVEARGVPLVVRPARIRGVIEAAREAPEHSWQGALVPDDVVYGVDRVERVTGDIDPERWLDGRGGGPPKRRLLVILEGQGVVLGGMSAGALDAMEEELLAHALIRRLAGPLGTLRTLDDEERRYLSEMESEAYRQTVAATGDDGAGACRS